MTWIRGHDKIPDSLSNQPITMLCNNLGFESATGDIVYPLLNQGDDSDARNDTVVDELCHNSLTIRS